MKKFYIYSPEFKTGGPQSLHQLAHELDICGYCVNMIYVSGKDVTNRQRALYYENLNICTDDSDIDDRESIVIVPEVLTYKLHQFQQAVKVIWWLSVEFYKGTTLWGASKGRLRFRGLPEFLTPLEVLYRLLFHRDTCVPALHTKKQFSGIYHFYNCEYVRRYLLSKDIDGSNSSYLCGYIDESYFEKVDITNKKRIITYNPAKVANTGFMEEFKIRVQQEIDDVKIVPISGMSKEEVFEILKESMLYVDFGTFPGPERIPRQAVCMYNNILTSDIGSAGNNEDVPINDTFKIALKSRNIPYAVSAAKRLIDNYEGYMHCFDEYRRKAVQQRDEFRAHILNGIKRIEERSNV